MKAKIIFPLCLFLFTQFGFGQSPWTGTTLTETISRDGNVKVNSSLNNGTIFSSATDRLLRSNVLRLGTELSTTGSIFNFMDFPASNYDTQAQSFFGIEDRNYKSRFRFSAKTGGSSAQQYFDKNQSAIYSLTENGSGLVKLELSKLNTHVMIGTNSYQDNTDTYHLSVNGKIRAEGVKVYTDWADFVFEDTYQLPSLEDVEKHINDYGHLKDIPSAQEVEENGIELGEMNKLLLQKIEELTLYTIELKKEIALINSKID